MSKAILVMDMPNNCKECELYVCYRQYAGDKGDCFCGMTKKDADFNNRPKSCPLREVPKKKRTIGKENENDKLCINAGWNDCIDEILKVGAE